jgi:hypothetical protein
VKTTIEFLLTQWDVAPLAISFSSVLAVLVVLSAGTASPSSKEGHHSETPHRVEMRGSKLRSTKNGKKVPPLEARLEVSQVNANQQFWWGLLGGCTVALWRLWFYASDLTPDAPWPHASFRTCLFCFLWFALPFVSGLLSRVCEPRHRLMAVFEGATAPALFIAVARDFPL